MFDTISGDRLRRELDLLLQEEEPLKPLLRAASLGVLQGIYAPLDGVPGLQRLVGAAQPDDSLVYLAAVVSHLTAEEGEAFIKRLNLTSRWAQVVRDTIALKPLMQEVASTSSVVQLCRKLDGLSHSAVKARSLLEGKCVAGDKLRSYLSEYRYIKPSLSGRELLALGVPQGPTVGAVLCKLREARLEGKVASRSEEVTLVGALLKDPTLPRTG
jgi:tRNA nucleotidyltransferase (CCA-adding enzyme)